MKSVLNFKNDTVVMGNQEEDLSLETNWLQDLQCDIYLEKMNSKSDLVQNILKQFKKPTKIQAQSIVPCLSGYDVIVQATTGCGKSSAAIISVLLTIDVSLTECQVLFLVPDNDTAEQTKRMISALCTDQENLRCCIVNTTELENEENSIPSDPGTQIIIGCPESILHLLTSRSVIGCNIKTVILDEADVLLCKAGKNHIECLLDMYVNWTTQIIALCSEISEDVLEFKEKRMADPVEVIMKEGINELVQEDVIPKENHTQEANDLTLMDIDVRKSTVVTETVELSIGDEFGILDKLLATELRNLSADERISFERILNIILHYINPSNYVEASESLSRKLLGIEEASLKTNTSSYNGCNSVKLEKNSIDCWNKMMCTNVTPLTTPIKVINHFEDAPLKLAIKHGIWYDFKKPLLLQKKSLVLCLKGHNLLIQAPSKSGKTTSMIITALHALNTNIKACQALIVVPNRDLVQHVQMAVTTLSQSIPDCICHIISNEMEMKQYSCSGAHIVIATPIFMIGMLNQQCIKSDHVKVFALDEADTILHEVDEEEIVQIFDWLPAQSQVILTSSQSFVSPKIQSIPRDFVHVIVDSDDILLDEVKQYYALVRTDQQRYNNLRHIIWKLEKIFPILVFCNTIREVNELYTQLERDGSRNVSYLTETLDQQKFEEFMRDFKSKSKKILVSSDQFASFIDIEYVPLIINYVLPLKLKNFVERIRRSGRYKFKSKILSLVSDEEKSTLSMIEKQYKIEFNEINHYDNGELSRLFQ